MEIVIGIVGSIAAVFIVIFGGRGLARGMRERRSQPSASWGCRRSASDSQHSL